MPHPGLHHAGKSALRYELGVDILAGNLVWIQGPYPASKYSDIKFLTRFCVISSSRASGSRPARGTAATPTKSNARAMMQIRQIIGQCRGG